MPAGRMDAIRDEQCASLRRLRRQAARHAGAGRVREALDIQRQVTALAPDDAQGFLQLGLLHRREGEIPQATLALERARSLAPADPNACAALAEIYLDAKRFEEAMRECKSLIALVPASVPARQVLSSIYFHRGQMERALDVLREIVRLSPMDSISHLKLGMLLHQQSKWRGALDAFTAALQLAPKTSLEYAEAESSLDLLNRQQMQVILTLAADDRLFQLRLARDAEEATRERGFFLTSEATQYVQHLATEHASDAELFGMSLTDRPVLYN